jgi:hypothetical protein
MTLDPIFSASSYDVEDLSNEDKVAVWDKIINCLRQVLASEFSDPYKREPITHADRVQFACPYCGDSLKDNRKKRGNLFQDTLYYHCFNGDCGARMPIYYFLKQKHLLDNFSLPEQLYLKNTASSSSIDLKQIKEKFGLESFFSDEIKNLSINRKFLMKSLKLQEITGSRIEKYLVGRMQTDFQKFAYDPKVRNVFVFNLTADREDVIGLQIKTFKKRNPYLTHKLSSIHEMLGIYDEDHKEQFEKIDHLSNIFGIFTVDINKPITIFEGPLDSFLFPNSVGICSAKNSIPFDIEGARYFYDNDKTGKDYAMRKISNGKSVFLWRKYIEDNKLSSFSYKIKDLNDLLMFIRDNKRKYTKFVDYFSKDRYDMMFI